MEYGNLHMRINEILQEKGISKNKICKDLDIPEPTLTNTAVMMLVVLILA